MGSQPRYTSQLEIPLSRHQRCSPGQNTAICVSYENFQPKVRVSFCFNQVEKKLVWLRVQLWRVLMRGERGETEGVITGGKAWQRTGFIVAIVGVETGWLQVAMTWLGVFLINLSPCWEQKCPTSVVKYYPQLLVWFEPRVVTCLHFDENLVKLLLSCTDSTSVVVDGMSRENAWTFRFASLPLKIGIGVLSEKKSSFQPWYPLWNFLQIVSERSWRLDAQTRTHPILYFLRTSHLYRHWSVTQAVRKNLMCRFCHVTHVDVSGKKERRSDLR